MCHDKVGWNEPLPGDLKPRWESWLLDLKNLADIKIKRCYLPEEFADVKRFELHHFSDASGYINNNARRFHIFVAKGLIISNWFTSPDFLWHGTLPAGDVKVGDLTVEDPELRKTLTEDSLLTNFSSPAGQS